MMSDESKGEMVRKNGQFVAGQSGNPAGRPKGSKNRITILKLQAEESVRENNAERMGQVCNQIIDAALDGDSQARKMVWDAMMSKAAAVEDKAAGHKQKIEVGTMHVTTDKPLPNVIEGETINVEIEDNNHE